MTSSPCSRLLRDSIRTVVGASPTRASASPATQLGSPNPCRRLRLRLDWWSLDETAFTLTRHHVSPRLALHMLTRTWVALPCDESRSTGHRKTHKTYKDGTSIVQEDQDFRTLENPNRKVHIEPIASWRVVVVRETC